MFGWTGKALTIDLYEKTFTEQELSSSFCKEWLGGKGFNLGTDSQRMDQNAQEQDSIRIAVGTLVGTPILGANLWCVEGKHPYTGKSISVYGTGPWGITLKYSGFDQLILTRTASLPSVLVIGENECHIETFNNEHIEPYFSQKMKEKYGPQTEVLIFREGSIEGRGCIGGDLEDIGLLLRQRNVQAIVIQGNKNILFANHAEVLRSSQQSITKWRELGLPFGHNGCAVCHGRCRQLPTSSDEIEEAFPEMLSLWLALGLCPQWMKSGLGLSLEEILSLLKSVTGIDYDVSILFEVARKIQEASTTESYKERRLV